jgi:hypothetical protein
MNDMKSIHFLLVVDTEILILHQKKDTKPSFSDVTIWQAVHGDSHVIDMNLVGLVWSNPSIRFLPLMQGYGLILLSFC